MSKYQDGNYGTLAGIALIGKVLAGRCTLKYTKATVGKGSIPDGKTPKTMDGSAEYVMDVPISGITNPVDGECQVSVQISSASVTTGFYCTNVVLYAQDPDSGEIPFTYLVMENEPEWIHSSSSSVGKLAAIDLISAVGDVDHVEATIDEDTIATVAVVNQAVNDLKSKTLPLAGGTLTGPLILADGYNAYGVASNAAAHNAMPPRFKNLGTAATSDIHAAIKAGTFDDIFVGDYFMVGNNPIYIGALDWYLNCGDTSCSEHHALLVPGNNLYTFHMNATDVTEGGYVGSDMYKNGLTQAKQFFSDAFGAAHILSHRQYLVNAVSGGKPTGTDWYDSTVELMNENMVYGGRQFSPMPDGAAEPWNTCRNYTIDKGQIPLFQYAPWLICNRNWYWLRDVVSTANFAHTNAYGYTGYTYASSVGGVRPVAGLIG